MAGILPLAEGQSEGEKALRMAYQGQERDLIPEGFARRLRRRAACSPTIFANLLSAAVLRVSAEAQSNTIMNMGVLETLRVGVSYAHARLALAPESSLEDFLSVDSGIGFIGPSSRATPRRSGEFPARKSPRNGGRSASRVYRWAKLRARIDGAVPLAADTAQRGMETSLIERFLYPKFGPGQMWEEVARRIAERGGDVFLNHRVVGIERHRSACDGGPGARRENATVRRVPCDYFISTIPVRDLITMLEPAMLNCSGSRRGSRIGIS